MSDSPTELKAELRLHQRIRSKLKTTWTPFFAKFRRLRAIQLEVIPHVLNQTNLLVTAPTAGGKTEAVMAPVCEIIKQKRLAGLSCIYITPTRALVNDLYERLSRPIEHLGLRLERKTSDHSQIRQPNIVITTPESVESLLSFKKELLKDVRIIVIDEVHLLDGTPRGDQLRFLLARLQRYVSSLSSGTRLQRIAISATVCDPERVATAYLGDQRQIVSVAGQRDIDFKVVQSEGDVVETTLAGIDDFPDTRKSLVFVNRRVEVDTLTARFRKRLPSGIEVFGHHGSLDRDARLEVETEFRRCKRGICIATMTLEIGVDIGDVDLVVCIDPPFTLAGFLQRIGRGGRRNQSATQVLCVARKRIGQIIFEAFIQQSQHGIPKGPVAPLRQSVLVQQILAYLKQLTTNRVTLSRLEDLFSTSDKPVLPRETVEAIVYDMEQSELLNIRGKIIRHGREGNEFIESQRIYSNLAPVPTVPVINEATGKTVAYVGRMESGNVQIAGKAYTQTRRRDDAIFVRPADAETTASSPTYMSSGRVNYSHEVGACLAGMMQLENELARVGDMIFTWLGKLMNDAIAIALRSDGVYTTGHTFCLRLQGHVQSSEIEEVIKAAVSKLVCHRVSLDDWIVNEHADCGAHHSLLSGDAQFTEKFDWIDGDFLTDWANSGWNVVEIELGDARYEDLLLIAQL